MAQTDAQYEGLSYKLPELGHRYGKNVHILSDPLALTQLSHLSAKGVGQPLVNQLVTQLYRTLIHCVAAAQLPRITVRVRTRMIDVTPAGVWAGPMVDPDTRVVVTAVARAGVLPAQVIYDDLNLAMSPTQVRQDYLALSRTTDAGGRVSGAQLGSAKIGGPIADAFVIIPDPMAATGSTLSSVLDAYASADAGAPRKILALHLIVTPEYLRRVADRHPEVEVYAFRLDRGLSPSDVLASVPGERWDEERGLNDNQYIVPGAGGLGEVMTNSYV